MHRDKLYENTEDLFLKEQFRLNSSSNQFGMYLKEYHPKTVEEMPNLADQFIEAHSYSSFVKDFLVFQNQNPRHSGFRSAGSRTGSKQQPSSTSSQQNYDRRCYICYRNGHLANDCNNKQTHLLLRAATRKQ